MKIRNSFDIQWNQRTETKEEKLFSIVASSNFIEMLKIFHPFMSFDGMNNENLSFVVNTMHYYFRSLSSKCRFKWFICLFVKNLRKWKYRNQIV